MSTKKNKRKGFSMRETTEISKKKKYSFGGLSKSRYVISIHKKSTSKATPKRRLSDA
jgi:hypothetical protein